MRRARVGAEVGAVLPHIEQEIDRMARALDNRMMAAIAAGKLTPEMAVEGWMERAACAKLLKNFQSIVRLGQNPEGLTFQK